MSASKSSRSISDLWLSTAEANLAMWSTLSFRMPMLMAGTMTEAERTRMVSEKMEAASESMRGAALVMGQLALRGPAAFFDPKAGFDSAVKLMTAASKPYHQRLAANARRLGRAR